MLDSATTLERRRQLLRFVLLGVIVLTIPFYCIGFFLWGTAPQINPATQEATLGATNTPLGGELRLTVTATSTIPLFGTSTQVLAPTPGQFVPLPTSVLPPTFVYLTPTSAPTLTPIPTNTPTFTTLPPTLVPPSNTPVPTNTSLPTSTNTDIPTATTIPPTNTDIPTPTDSFIPPPSDTPTA